MHLTPFVRMADPLLLLIRRACGRIRRGSQPSNEHGSTGVSSPSKARILSNLVVFEAAWLGCIVSAAHDHPAFGTALVAVAIAWHIAISERPLIELALAGLLCALGFVVEAIVTSLGYVSYSSGQPVAWLAPYWIVALWGQFATTLNVTLRWLKRRHLLAAALGAIFGPLSFLGGVRLGGAQFVDRTAALASLAIEWGLMMPLVMALSTKFDGVVASREHD